MFCTRNCNILSHHALPQNIANMIFVNLLLQKYDEMCLVFTATRKIIFHHTASHQGMSTSHWASTPVHARASSNAQSDSSRFSLAILIASSPKLNRKSSGRAIGSSCKSDSDSERKSVTGESGVSLMQKHGVCQKVAMVGRGATSVAPLAHKWERCCMLSR